MVTSLPNLASYFNTCCSTLVGVLQSVVVDRTFYVANHGGEEKMFSKKKKDKDFDAQFEAFLKEVNNLQFSSLISYRLLINFSFM